MKINAPYLLYIGGNDPLSIKMAQGVAHWRPDKVVGEMAQADTRVSTGAQRMTLQQGVEAGAKSLVIGFSNSGGRIDADWSDDIVAALNHGLDVVSGMHQRLDSVDAIRQAALANGANLLDIRHPSQTFNTGTGRKRRGRRLLTVGSDCSVGKMYTALSLTEAMRKRGDAVDFRATGQCGILIAGEGVAVDCVVADFIAGAAEALTPDNEPHHWDVIEGQGSLSHPAFAGVSLGLLHGSQPDAIVVCHAEARAHMRGVPHCPTPNIADTLRMNLEAARLTNPAVYCAGIALNTSALSESAAEFRCHALADELGLPCVDPLRHGVDALLETL